MRIKLFEQFYKATVLDEVNDCLVDLRDNGFEWSCSYLVLGLARLDSVLDISLHKIDRSGFRIGDIKDSLETMIEYFDEKYGVKSYSFMKPDSPGPGIEVKLYDKDDDSVIARHGSLKELNWLNIKINLGRTWGPAEK
jgi:hypothetical protein